MVKIYVQSDARTSAIVGGEDGSKWLSTSQDPSLEVCHPASSEDVKKMWNAGFGDFQGEVLELSNGSFRAIVQSRPRPGTRRKIQFIELVPA